MTMLLQTTRWLLPLFALLVVAGCKSEPEPEKKDFGRALPEGAPALERVTDLSELPDLTQLHARKAGMLAALAESRAYFEKPSSQDHFPYQTADRAISHADMVATLATLEEVLRESNSGSELEGRLLQRFDVYRSVGWDGSGEVLFTAYCEPIFDGRMVRDETYRYPLYKLPPDLVKEADGTPLGRRTPEGSIVPYWTRAQIDQDGHLRGQELVWLKDPFEVYVAHVQGSARIRMADGDLFSIGYAGKTDHPYHSIGLELVREGQIDDDDLSLTTLEQYFAQRPDEVDRVLPKNPSYVFFTEREPGPFGSIGAKVTPYHSVATDKSVFPRGGPVLVASRLPFHDPRTRTGVRKESTALLAFDQDTGGAIRSAGRCDVFVGTGDAAKKLAGYTREEGRLYYFFVKP